MKGKSNLVLPVLVMVALAITRWPGLLPMNFSAVYALLFCAGIYFPAGLRWVLPLVTLGITVLVLDLAYYHVSPFSIYTMGTYLAFLPIIWLGTHFKKSWPWVTKIVGGFGAAILFYLVTNTIAWMIDPWYPKSLAGWIQALTTGKPGWPQTWELFRNTFLSGGLFAGLFAAAMDFSPQPEEEKEEAEVEEGEESEAGEARPC